MSVTNTTHTWLAALTAVLALTATACAESSAGSDAGQAGDNTASQNEDGTRTVNGHIDESTFVSRVLTARVHIVIGGDFAYEWTDQIGFRIIEDPEGTTLGKPVFSLGVDGPQQLGETTWTRIGADIVGDTYGPGRYVIAATSEGSAAESFPNAVLFLLFDVIDPSAPVTEENVAFQHELYLRIQDCVLEISDGETGGSLTCPEMSDYGAPDVRASMRMTWEFVNDAD